MNETHSKAPLVLMEQVVMILVFAFAAAISVWAFTWSNATSVASQETDSACIVAEQVAETIRQKSLEGGGVAEVLAKTSQELGVAFDSADQSFDVPVVSGITIEARAAEPKVEGTQAVDVVCEAYGFTFPVVWQVNR